MTMMVILQYNTRMTWGAGGLRAILGAQIEKYKIHEGCGPDFQTEHRDRSP